MALGTGRAGLSAAEIAVVAAAVREVALRKRANTTRGALRQAEEALEKAVAELEGKKENGHG